MNRLLNKSYINERKLEKLGKGFLLVSPLFFLLALILPANKIHAKDLTNRLGIGYSNQFSVDMPSIAARYYPSRKLGLSAALGVDTQDKGSKFGLMVRVYRIIFSRENDVEDNMNFYMGTGAGIISTEVLTTNSSGELEEKNESGFELVGYAGGEFFITGLESLGFSFEMGVGVTSISSQVRFRTLGDHPIKAGLTFYF